MTPHPNNGTAVTSEKPSLLSLRGLEKTFKTDLFKPAVQSLKGIDLDFPEGECTGLVGHNGAGKTTTIRIILGLIHPDRGQVTFRGQPMARNHRGLIGYMPETARMPGTLTPLEVLQTQLSLHKINSTTSHDQLIDAKLESVGLLAHKKRTIGSFSKGMQQRLAWAHATIHSPDLLILDEPFSGLDPLGRITMKNWILAEKKQGITIVLCTHELPQIMSLCHHIQILKLGQVVYSSIKNNGQDQFYAKHLAHYYVEISGTSSSELEKTQKQLNLPRWQHLEQDGFLSRLGFSDYPSATPWVTTCINKGWVVVRFGDDNSATEEQLLVHFKEEFTL